MGKKTVISIVVWIIAMLIGMSAYKIVEKEKSASKIRHLPEFEAMTLEGNTFHSMELLRTEKPTLMIFFHPECEFCGMEMEQLIANREILYDINLLLITFASEDELVPMIQQHNILLIPNVKVLFDENREIFNLFGVTAPPTIVVYDKTGRIMKKKLGAQAFELLQYYIDRANER